MSNLSEEETILYLEHTAEDDFNLEEHQRHNRYLAIKTILDLYNKLKQDYEILKDDIEGHRIAYIDTPVFQDLYISKDKIREEIKELRKDILYTRANLEKIIETWLEK